MATQVYSQNGYPAYADTSRFTRFSAANQGWWAANPDVATCFTELIERFDKEVEEITQGTLDDWSYANRLIRGSTSAVSNHGSATAIDINALQHVLGRSGTFSATQVKALRKILNDITDNAGRPIFRWGGDYVNRKDEMHFEINVTPASGRVAQAATKIRKAHAQEDDKVAEVTIDLDQKVRLSAAAAKAMSTGSTTRKKDDEVSLSYLFQWGGAGQYRAWKDVLATKALAQANAAQIGALSAAVSTLAAAIGKPGTLTAAQITTASEAGAKAALAQLGPLFEALDDDPDE